MSLDERQPTKPTFFYERRIRPTLAARVASAVWFWLGPYLPQRAAHLFVPFILDRTRVEWRIIGHGDWQAIPGKYRAYWEEMYGANDVA